MANAVVHISDLDACLLQLGNLCAHGFFTLYIVSMYEAIGVGVVELVGFGGLGEDAVDVLHCGVPLSFLSVYIITQGEMKVNRKMKIFFVKFF